jgi:WD40 repeat protein
VGAGVDACNQTLASICHAGVLRTWAFKTGALTGTLALPGNASTMHLHPHSQLAAVASLDLGIRVVDVQQVQVVRLGIRNKCSFSRSSRWSGHTFFVGLCGVVLFRSASYDHQRRFSVLHTMPCAKMCIICSLCVSVPLCKVVYASECTHWGHVVLGLQVRHFKGHTDRLTDVQISADSKWVLSSSLDSTVRVWDIPRATCLQAMHVGSPVTCLSLSPHGEMLATGHVGRRGVYLWSNQMLFGVSGGTHLCML